MSNFNLNILTSHHVVQCMQQPPPYAPPGGAPPPAAMVSKVDLTISCQGLRDADVFSKSDPICVLYNLEGSRKREVS